MPSRSKLARKLDLRRGGHGFHANLGVLGDRMDGASDPSTWSADYVKALTAMAPPRLASR